MSANAVRENVVLEPEMVTIIRRALLVGLESFGEIERLQDEQEGLSLIGREVKEPLRVIHPTGAPDTTKDFAAALAILEYAPAEEER